jgi:transcriptional regulator with XRE-family HTH domain
MATTVLLESEVVEWKVIRSAFIKARGRRTQGDIATAGGLHQSSISKLESNDKLGPAVEVFVKAIEGLGVKPSVFFAAIEQATDQKLLDPRRPTQIDSQEATSGSRSLQTPPTIPEEDVKAFLRVLRDALGGSILTAIGTAKQPRRPRQTRRSATGARARRTKRRKTS